MCVCMYERMFLRVTRWQLNTYVCMYGYMCICMYESMFCVSSRWQLNNPLRMHVCMDICVYVCMNGCFVCHKMATK
jgi:hypothetical protein